MPIANPTYEKAYSDQRFWRKATRHASAAGRQALEKALWLYYAVQNPATPKWARRVIYGALGYFVLPLDAIPDLAPLVGYTDDLGVMTAALATVAFYINDDVKHQASSKLNNWFGASAPASPPATSRRAG
ncbi:MAG TPA: YkvA family protein [Bordetella sp.]|nr:YkvA family protein [Bordetella sp.]